VSARNIYHSAVVHALTADGWTITDDPLRLEIGDRNLYVDLGAEQGTVAAERAGRKIAVEIQSFLGHSPVRDLQEAAGQYGTYRGILRRIEPDRVLYLGVPNPIYETLFEERIGRLIVAEFRLRLMVFDHRQQRILQWIELTNTDGSSAE
jgi:hypothetical protein